jgi:hypothetical protein
MLITTRGETADLNNRFYILKARVSTIEKVLENKLAKLEIEKVKCDERRPLKKKKSESRPNSK